MVIRKVTLHHRLNARHEHITISRQADGPASTHLDNADFSLLGAQIYIAPPHLTPHPVKTTNKRLYHHNQMHQPPILMHLRDGLIFRNSYKKRKKEICLISTQFHFLSLSFIVPPRIFL
jgi:hypothetical protein